MKYQRNCKRYSEVVTVKISSTESFCSTSQFFGMAVVLIYTFVIVKASTQKEGKAVVAQACFSASSFSVMSFLRFTHGAWQSTGRGVVRVSRICSTEIKIVKISSEKSGHILRNFAPACISSLENEEAQGCMVQVHLSLASAYTCVCICRI